MMTDDETCRLESLALLSSILVMYYDELPFVLVLKDISIDGFGCLWWVEITAHPSLRH